MNKSIILLLGALLVCVSGIHMQRYAYGPSAPAGQPQYQPRPQAPGPQPAYPGGGYNQPPQRPPLPAGSNYYQYVKPFELQCVAPDGTVTKKDSCSNANDCNALISSYRSCKGSVKKFTRG